MSDDNIRTLVAQGLSAMRAGSDIAAKATDEISNDATHPALKQALEAGNRTSKQWAERIERAAQQVGQGEQGDNPILQAHYEVGKKIRAQATDDTSRDLGIIASGQLALHYWIAAFGTMASYTKQIGLTDVASDMKSCVDEAKQGDEKMTGVAEQLLTA